MDSGVVALLCTTTALSFGAVGGMLYLLLHQLRDSAKAIAEVQYQAAAQSEAVLTSVTQERTHAAKQMSNMLATLTEDRNEFFTKLSEIQAGVAAERAADREEVARQIDEQRSTYEQFLEQQAKAEQVIEDIDKKWIDSPESEVEPDPDLDWEKE